MRVISYNLRKNRASSELIAITEKFEPDVLCLQEADTVALPVTLGPLRLADSTLRNRLGLALYYRDDRFAAVRTQAFELKKSLHDRLLRPAHERLIGTRMRDMQDGRELVIASFHAAPLTALNSLRRQQIAAAHEQLRVLATIELPSGYESSWDPSGQRILFYRIDYDDPARLQCKLWDYGTGTIRDVMLATDISLDEYDRLRRK